ncbi:MAG: DUF4167 domain-containing protein [Hyphomonadaceae bacterium]
MKRQRGRGRKPGGGHHQGHHNQPNRTLESNGPDIKVRGPAAHIYERYLQLARDASSSGDRVMGENYLQHAEHYFRMLRAMQPAAPPPQPDRFAGGEFEGDEEGRDVEAVEGEAVEDAEGGEQPEAAYAQQNQGGERGDGEGRRRRGRRNRFRPDGERDGGEGEQATAREGDEQPRRRERDEGEDQPRRERRETRGEREGGESREGFAGPGPKPAFLGSE